MDISQLTTDYLNHLIDECINHAFSQNSSEEKIQKRLEIEEYFYDIIFKTLLQNATPLQLNRLKEVDFASEKGLEEIRNVAAEIPEFFSLLDQALQKEKEIIKNTGQIPVIDPDTLFS